jgi:hypothetical protein
MRFRNIAISITAFALGLGLIALSSHAQSNKSTADQKEASTPRAAAMALLWKL